MYDRWGVVGEGNILQQVSHEDDRNKESQWILLDIYEFLIVFARYVVRRMDENK